MKNNIPVKNDLFDYLDRYIFQIPSFFKFSVDSILLAEYVEVFKRTKNILDLCTGNAPIPLILSKYTSASITCFEIQEVVAKLAEESIKVNNLENQITLINDDIKNINKYFKPETFDIIVCNPPYFEFTNDKSLNKVSELSIARHEIKINLEDIFKIVKDNLKSNGTFYMIHRPNRLDEIINYATKYNVFVKEIQFILTNPLKEASLVIVKCVKNSNKGLKIKKNVDISNLTTYQGMFRKEVNQ
ncbi:MAG: methyltransferase [Bacilli bacterium]